MAPMKPLAPSKSVTTRDPKGLKFVSIVEAAYNKAGLSEAEAQRINDTPGLSDHIASFIAEHRVREEFKDEEVKSSYVYLSGYKPGVQDLDRQIKILQEQFPGLGGLNPELLEKIKSGQITLPNCTEKLFAVVNWKKSPAIKTYAQAVQRVLDLLRTERKGAFHNYREGQIDDAHLRQSVRSEAFWDELAKAQGNPDILIIAAQFGKKHAGRSVRRARVIMEDTPGEVGLGAFSTGCMLLTHPERLQNCNDLWIDLAGDEWSPRVDGVFSGSPYFYFGDDELKFGAHDVDGARDYCGSASVFPPQYPEPCTSKF